MKLKLTVIAWIILATVSFPPLVSAHAEPESSTPLIGGTVTEAPTEVEVVFSQEVVRQGTDSSITVTDALGADVTTGPSEVDDVDRHIIRVGLQPDLANGTYTVGWRTLSAGDGDPAAGSFIFTVAVPAPTPTDSPTEPPEAEATEEETPQPTPEAEATASATAAVDSAQSDDDDGFPTWVIVVAVVGLIVVAGVGAGSYIFVRNS